MNITDVRVRKIESEGRTRAFASITIDEVFVVHDLRVIEGQSGLFVAMPSRKTAEGEYKDIAHPITTEARELISATVLEAYSKA